jgi:hypothetical protein
MTTDVLCPTCNTVSHFEDLERDADGFCSTCDYPLFWANRTAFAEPGRVSNERIGLRRLPGTEGWAIPQQILCPVCGEPNLLTEDYCVRDGAELRPKPPPPEDVPEPAPPDVEPVQVRAQRDWLPLLVIAAFVVVGLVVWLVTAYVIY